jgi:hypothetical protein
MNTRAACYRPGSGLEQTRAPLQLLQRTVRPAPALQVADAPHAGWVERLTAWAERQPPFHRMGSWERLR